MPSRGTRALLALASAGAAAAPTGHLEPFGGWKPGTPVKVWDKDKLPTPREFFDHCQTDGGASEPVLLPGAAAGMKAMEWTSDDVLLERHADAKIDGVEYQLKETRAGGKVKGMKKMKDFLGAYNKTDIYMVSKVPKPMQKEVDFMPMMRCGGYLNYLDVPNMWMGRGGSKSVVHYDDQDNFNCLFSGKKKFLFMHPKYKKQFEAHPNTKKNKFGWVDTDLDNKIPGYGAFMGRIDVDKMDLIKYPGWKDVDWSYAELSPGDCIFIPYQWYHQVTAEPTRSINVHVWYWRPKKFDEKSCEQDRKEGGEAGGRTLGSCTWGYEPPKGHLGVTTKGGKKPTKCKWERSRAKKAEL